MKFTSRLEKTTRKLQKVRHRLESLLVVHERLQILLIDYRILLVSAFSDYKSTTNVHFFITKVCSVRFLRLQKFVSVRFLRLQKFVVSAFWDYKSL